MNKFNILQLKLFLAILLLGPVGAQESKVNGLIPKSPQLLLQCLPKQLEGYKLITSTGSMKYSSWLETIVVREFEMIQGLSEEQEKAEPPRIRFTLTDTAKFPASSIAQFAKFEPGRRSNGVLYRYRNGMPVIVIRSLKANWQEGRILINNRFILTIKLTNQEPKIMGELVKSVRVRLLNSVHDGEKIALPSFFTSEFVDELKPERSRKFKVYTSKQQINYDDEEETPVNDGFPR